MKFSEWRKLVEKRLRKYRKVPAKTFNVEFGLGTEHTPVELS
jgi:hypothetical protein